MQLKNHLEIFKLLPKTNCRNCGLASCMAFAVAVYKGQKPLADCPHLQRDSVSQYEVQIEQKMTLEQQQALLLEQLQQKIAAVDFAAAAPKIKAALGDNRLIIKCLGRDFAVNRQGRISSACHVIPWVTIPLLDYIITCCGGNLTGRWLPFRELKSGAIRNPLFARRCEQPLKEMADANTELFRDVLTIFGGKPAQAGLQADIALALWLLPHMPLLVNYSQARQEIPSRLSIFYDAAAEQFLSIDSIHLLTTGFVTMLEKIFLRHG